MIFKPVLNLCKAAREAGGRALFVGGWVRDFVRGESNLDYDVEVYGIESAALRAMLDSLGKVDAVGEAFTVYKVRLREAGQSVVVDVSLPRRESKTRTTTNRGSRRKAEAAAAHERAFWWHFRLSAADEVDLWPDDASWGLQ